MSKPDITAILSGPIPRVTTSNLFDCPGDEAFAFIAEVIPDMATARLITDSGPITDTCSAVATYPDCLALLALHGNAIEMAVEEYSENNQFPAGYGEYLNLEGTIKAFVYRAIWETAERLCSGRVASLDFREEPVIVWQGASSVAQVAVQSDSTEFEGWMVVATDLRTGAVVESYEDDLEKALSLASAAMSTI